MYFKGYNFADFVRDWLPRKYRRAYRAARNAAALPICGRCGRRYWPARPGCPHCRRLDDAELGRRLVNTYQRESNLGWVMVVVAVLVVLGLVVFF